MKNILYKALGENMSLIHEYGDRKEQKGKEEGIKEGIKEGKKEIIIKFLKSGMSAEEISERLNAPLEEIQKIKEKIV